MLKLNLQWGNQLVLNCSKMIASQDSINLKEKQVDNIADKIKNSKTLMIVSVKGLPSKQFQEIKKSIRNEALVKITKKNIILRALKKFGKESALNLKDYIESDFALVISDKDGYELAAMLSKKKIPVFARAGQIASSDIEIKKGPTTLVPGPVISELGALGIQIAVEDGKISIKAPKVVVSEGKVINENVASLLQKLNIQSFEIGLEPLVIYDVEHEKIYINIKIDSNEAVKGLSLSARKALGLARNIFYYSKDTIGYLLARANLEFKAISKLLLKKVIEEGEKQEIREQNEMKVEKTEEAEKENEDEIYEKESDVEKGFEDGIDNAEVEK